MTNWYKIFYWLTISDGLKGFFDTTSNIFTFFAVVSFIVYVFLSIARASVVSSNKLKSEDDDKKDADLRSVDIGRKFSIRFFYPTLILALITWVGYVITPTKKDCLFIIAGGAVGNFMTTDSSAKELPADITKFLHMSLQNEIKDLSSDAKKELGVQTKKEKLLDDIKDMSKEQIIEYFEKDTTNGK